MHSSVILEPLFNTVKQDKQKSPSCLLHRDWWPPQISEQTHSLEQPQDIHFCFAKERCFIYPRYNVCQGLVVFRAEVHMYSPVHRHPALPYLQGVTLFGPQSHGYAGPKTRTGKVSAALHTTVHVKLIQGLGENFWFTGLGLWQALAGPTGPPTGGHIVSECWELLVFKPLACDGFQLAPLNGIRVNHKYFFFFPEDRICPLLDKVFIRENISDLRTTMHFRTHFVSTPQMIYIATIFIIDSKCSTLMKVSIWWQEFL